MFKRLKYVVVVGFAATLAITATATAQETLGFTIDPTQGLPGDVVSGQVDPDDIAAQCTTELADLQAVFLAVLEGPFAGGGEQGELFSRFFPGGTFVFETCEQAAYSLTGITVLAIALNIMDAAVTALPQTFVMTFVDLATQDPLGPLGHFDPVTGEGSVVVPDLDPGDYPVVATCVEPSLDLDVLEAGIRENGAFLESLGFPTCDLNDPAFAEHVEELLGPGADVFAFLAEFGPTFIQQIVVPDALGLQFFTILDQPETKDECKKDGWQQFEGLDFKNQGDCIAFFNAGLHAGTTAAE